MIVYKIQDKETGLFSTGGQRPKWNKKGKIWKSLGALKNHLNQFIDNNDFWTIGTIKPSLQKDVENWIIVEIEIIENPINKYSSLDIIKPKMDKVIREYEKEKEFKNNQRKIRQRVLNKLNPDELKALRLEN